MTDIDTLPPETLSPVSDKPQLPLSTTIDIDIPLPVTTSNGRSRGTKASSVISSNSSIENPSIPQISVTESSSTASPSIANGHATASESLSSLSEIDTVDSEAETERIEDLDDDGEQPLPEVTVDEDAEPRATDVVGGTFEDENHEVVPSRGRKRRRGTEVDDVVEYEKPLDMEDEERDAKLEPSETEEIERPADRDDTRPEEPEEPEPEESAPSPFTT